MRKYGDTKLLSQRLDHWASEMSQQVKVPGDLNLKPRAHVVERQKELPWVIVCPLYAHSCSMHPQKMLLKYL